MERAVHQTQALGRPVFSGKLTIAHLRAKQPPTPPAVEQPLSRSEQPLSRSEQPLSRSEQPAKPVEVPAERAALAGQAELPVQVGFSPSAKAPELVVTADVEEKKAERPLPQISETLRSFLAIAQEKWPVAFPRRMKAPVPLALGVKDRIHEELKGLMPPELIDAAMAEWTTRPAYLNKTMYAAKMGWPRINLDGTRSQDKVQRHECDWAYKRLKTIKKKNSSLANATE